MDWDNAIDKILEYLKQHERATNSTLIDYWKVMKYSSIKSRNT